MAGPARRTALWAGALASAVFFAVAGARADELTSAELVIRGSRLLVTPVEQTTAPGLPCRLDTELAGAPADPRLLVAGELAGPGLDHPLRLTAPPNEPLRVPGLRVEGDYEITGLRLERDGLPLLWAEPERAAIHVRQLLVGAVTSRPLTPAELARYGVAVAGENYRAYAYSVGFAVGSRVVTLDFPLVFDELGRLLEGPPGDQFPFTLPGAGPGDALPTVEPFQLEQVPAPRLEPGERDEGQQVRVFGLVVIPNDVAFLNQFFSVLLVIQNGADAGSGVTLREITAAARLPARGLREARTVPPRPFGTSVPVLAPGPDGETGTADDLTFVVAQAAGQAEWVVEGVNEGVHVVDFEIAATAEGLAAGAVPLAGGARGVVLVRDPRFALTFVHPSVVRAGERYLLRTVIANTSTVPVYELSVRLPAHLLQGAVLAGEDRVTIGELPPGEEAVAEFALEATVTGRVTATAFNTSDPLTARFELSVGVGELGIPLSPETLALPGYLDALPKRLVDPALSLLGLAHSLAGAPAWSLEAGLPPLGGVGVRRRAQDLAGHALRVRAGEAVERALGSFGLAWLGAGAPDPQFDALRRASRRNAAIYGEVAAALAQRATDLGGAAALDELEELLVGAGPALLVRARGAGFERAGRLVLSGRSSNRGAAGQPADTLAYRRDLPYAELLDVDSPAWQGEVGIVGSWAEEAGYQVQLHGSRDGSVDLEIVRVEANGTTWRWVAPGVSTSSCSLLTVDLAGPAAPAATRSYSRCTGALTDAHDVVPLQQAAPVARIVAARQDTSLNPTGRDVVLVLSQAAGDLGSWDAERALVASRLQAGGMTIERERLGIAAFTQFDPRVVVLACSSPLNASAELALSVSGLPLAAGGALDAAGVAVAVDPRLRFGVVHGQVIGSDGAPLAGVPVELFETDFRCFGIADGCGWASALADTVTADAAGVFLFDAVRYRDEPPDARVFTLRVDAPGGERGQAAGTLLAPDTVQKVDVVLLGRGSVRGYLYYDDGSPLRDPLVQARSILRPWEGGGTRPAADGSFVIVGLPVGPVQLFGRDGADLAFATTAIDRAGAVSQVVLVLTRSQPVPRGRVSGTVVSQRDGAPRSGIEVYLSSATAGGVTHRAVTDLGGRFAMSDVPAGNAELFGYDPALGRIGFTVPLTVIADRVNAVQAVFTDGAGRVRGTVRQLAAGRLSPVAGAVVSALGSAAWARTDAAGGYCLEGVPLGDVTVSAQAPPPPAGSGRRATAVVRLGADGQEVTLDLVLESRSGSVVGTVVDAEGRAVGGVTVNRVGAGFALESVRSGPDGRFGFERLAPGTLRLDAVRRASEFGSGTATVLYDGHRAETTLRLGSWGSVRLLVRQRTAAGEEVPVKAQVRFSRLTGATGVIEPGPLEEGETGDDGVLVIEDVPDGPFSVDASTLGAGRSAWSGTLAFPAHETRDVTLVLDAFGRVAGTVLDHAGELGVAGAGVRIWYGENGAQSQTVASSDEPGHAGEFRFDLVPQGAIRLEVTSGGRAALYRGALSEPGQSLDDLRLALSPLSGAVQARLAVCGGAGAGAAHLVARNESLPFLPERVVDHDLADPGPVLLSGLPAGAWTVRVTSALHGGAMTGFTVAAEGETVDLGEVCLAPTGRITGVVLDPRTGAPAAAVQARVLAPIGAYGSLRVVGAATTGGDGRFVFDGLPTSGHGWGLYAVQAFDPGSARGGQLEGLDLAAAPGNALDITLTLEALGSVRGTVRLASSEPVADARVQLSTGYRLNEDLSSSVETFATLAARDGAYRFDGVPQGSFRVEARDPASGLRRTVAGELRHEGEVVGLDLVLPPTARVAGTLREPSGNPVGDGAGAVTLTQREYFKRNVALRATSRANPYVFDGVVSGPFTLAASASLERGEALWPYGGSLDATMPDPPADLAVDVVLAARANLRVVVRQSGAAQAGAAVQVSGGPAGESGTREQTSQADGSAFFAALPQAAYTVSARYTPPGQTGAIGAVTRAAVEPRHDGGTVEVVLDLAPAGELRLQVLAPDATPAAGALATVRCGDGTFQAVADGGGAVRFLAVPQGACRLEVQDDDSDGVFRDDVEIGAGSDLDLGTLLLDAVNPAVVASAPAAGAATVPVDAEPAVSFSEPLRPASVAGAVALRGPGNLPVSAFVTLDPDGATIRVRPALPLAGETGYLLEVGRSVTDLAGRQLGQTFVLPFRTADVTRPRVAAVSPPHDPAGLRRVLPDVTPVVTFSEPVAAGSVGADSVRLLAAGSPVAGVTLRLERDGFDVRLLPPTGLTPDGTYRIEVTTAVTDPAGNPLEAPFASGFRVVTVTPPAVTLLAPLGAVVEAETWRLLEGQPVTLRAHVSSDDPVAAVGFTVNEADLPGAATLDGASGEWRMPWTVARLADLGGGAVLSAFARDVSGNRGDAPGHPLTVLVNAPPTGALRVTPETGVLPNHEVIARVAAQDDHGLARIAVSFTGACIRSEVRTVTGTNTAGEIGFACRCPVNAASGSAVTVRAEVTDAEGQTTVLGPTDVPVLADAAAPQVTTLEPAAGASFASGNDVTFRFSLSDEVMVSGLTLTVGGASVWIRTESASLPGTEWTATATASWLAPAVTATQPFHWVLTAADPAGHSTIVEGDVTITPLPAGPPPVVAIACPVDGDPVVGGNRVWVRFGAQAATSESPTNLIASYRLFVDGTEIVAREAIDRQSIATTEEWTPPDDAAIGRAFVIRVEARDLANVTGAAEVAVSVPAGTVLSGSQSLDASRDGEALVLADGTFTALEPLDLTDLIVVAGAKVVGEAGEPLDLSVAGTLHVACDAAIDASRLGHAGGTASASAGLAPADVSGAQPAAGGSHGGLGALVEGSGPAGEAFDSVVEPALSGGGGAAGVNGAPGAPGGGVVRLHAADLVVNGAVRANGGRAPGEWGGGAGAGGGVAVVADTVRGTGTLEAEGGWFQPSSYFIHSYGAGGGGRIAIEATSLQLDVTTRVWARGGESWSDDASGRRRRNSAGAGTVFVRGPGSSHGELIVDAGGPESGPVGLTPMAAIGGGVIGEVVGDGDDAWITPQDPATRFSLGVVGMWVRTAAGDFRVVAQENRRRIRLAGAAGAVQVGDAYEGVWKLDALTVRGRARVQFDDRAEVGVVTLAPDSVVSWANLDAPRIDPTRVTMSVRYGQFRVAGSAGAITDADGIANARLRNAASGWTTTISLGPQGAFGPMTIYGATGDAVEITATDAHERPRTVTVLVGALPANTGAPVVDVGRIRFAKCSTGGPGSPPDPGSAPGVRAAGLEPCVIGDPGAIADGEWPVYLRLRNSVTGAEHTGSAFEGGAFTVLVQGSPGDTFTLTATDSHPQPLATTVAIGSLPLPPNAPPAVDAGAITLLPLGFGFQVGGRPGAVTDADRPLSVVLSDATSGGSTEAVAVEADGSFYARLAGSAGDEIVVVATDGHPSEQASSAPVSLGLLPDLRPVPWLEELGGRVPTMLRDGFLLVDGGAAVWWLSGVPDGVDDRLYPDLGAARDAFFNLKLRAPMALDGGDLVGWVEEGEPAVRVPRRLAVSAGALVRGRVRGGETLLLAEEADGIRLFRLSTVADSGADWVPDCDALASDLLLDGTAGRRALELLPGPGGSAAVLTDDPGDELRMVVLSSPTTSAPAGSIDLAGESAPTWGRWQTGELHLGRADGSVELWRWGGGGPALFASFTPDAGAARASTRFGDQLWVGLDDGRLVQVDLTRGVVVGEIVLGEGGPEPVVGMAREGALLRVATTAHVWTLDLGPMPPTIAPDLAAWGHADGRSWAGLILPEPGAAEVRGRWEGGATATWQPCGHCLGLVAEDVDRPPSLTAVSWEGVPSPPFVPPSTPVRGFDSGTTPDLWLGPVGHGAAACDAPRGTLGASPGASTVLWRATGLAGEPGVTWATLEEGSGARTATRIETDGPLRDVFEAFGYLVVVDDGVRVLAVDAARGGDPLAPVPVQALAPGIGAPELVRRADFGPLLLTASEPARLAVVDLAPLEAGAGSVAVVADNVTLAEVGAPLLDLVAGGGHLYLLTAEGGAGRVYRYSFADPAVPLFLDAYDLPPGAPATALAYRFGDDTAGEEESLVVVRRGWGIEALAPDLAPLASVPLPGDARGAYWNWALYVLLGDRGVARVTGPPSTPFIDYLQANIRSPGDARRAGDHSLVTPEGLTWF